MRHEHAVAAAHWAAPRQPGKRRWWQSPTIIRHLNRVICGEPIEGAYSGLTECLRRKNPNGWDRGISIACGDGSKEMRLIKAGLVRHFDLFEITAERVERGKHLAERQRIADRVTFHTCDAFEEDLGSYDLVYWNNALHHMLDTSAAVKWSFDHLRTGGTFVMDDYVGPNRLQWTNRELDVAEGIRLMLPERYRRDPLAPENELPLRPLPATVDVMMRRDPTEAADSENIIPAVRQYFPAAEITFTGGVIYHVALNDVIANFTEEDDLPLLQALLLADEALARDGLTQYATAIADR
jgi:SAM-dependent methyltransferase